MVMTYSSAALHFLTASSDIVIYNSMSKFTLAYVGAVGDLDFASCHVGLAKIPAYVGRPRKEVCNHRNPEVQTVLA